MVNSINTTLETLFGKMDSFVSTKTVVGEAISVGDTTILPLVDISFGVGAGGGGSTENDKASSDGGGGGLGAKITPTAVLVVQKDTVQLLSVKNQNNLNKLIDLVPGITTKLGDIFTKKNKDSNEKTEITEESI